jgi:hypothetical protein
MKAILMRDESVCLDRQTPVLICHFTANYVPELRNRGGEDSNLSGIAGKAYGHVPYVAGSQEIQLRGIVKFYIMKQEVFC